VLLRGWRSGRPEDQRHLVVQGELRRMAAACMWREHRARKRGTVVRAARSVTHLADPGAAMDLDVVSLHTALEERATLDSRQAVRYRGASREETARVTGLSAATIKRDSADAQCRFGRGLQGNA